MAGSPSVEPVHADRLRQIADIAAQAEAEDGTSPLDEATWLAMRHRGHTLTAWVEADGFALVIEDELSLVVRPSARRHGTGTRLLEQALAELPDDRGTLRAWSHADHPAAERLAAGHGFEKVRELWVMRRPTSQPVGEVVGARRRRRPPLPAPRRGGAAARQRRGLRHPPRAGPDGRRRPRRADGRAVVRPRGPDRRQPRPGAARLPLDQAALPRARRGVRRRDRPRRPGHRPRPRPDPRRAAPPRRPRHAGGAALRRGRQRARGLALHARRLHPCSRRTPT